ncbi:MAG: lamin tail domain-containing protein [Candidatus Gracilibacteria bacterium]|nr:lamin tail domain-containing protein [Candidatus Gracilibacteria bacterium]
MDKRKIILRSAFLAGLFFIFIKVAYSLSAVNLYYWDLDFNSKVDRLGIEFDSQISGVPDFSKIQIYSNTGGLALRKINSEPGLFSNFSISGSFMYLDIIEQDNLKKDLMINNSTSSDLRLKTLEGVGITDISGVEMTKLSLTSSFGNYRSSYVFNRTFENPFISQEPYTPIEQNIDNTGSIIGTGELVMTGTTDTGSLSQTGESISIGFTGTTNGTGMIDEGDLGSGNTIEVGSGLVISSGSQEDVVNPGFTIPEISYVFQSPTYLQQSGTGIYICDGSKAECKMNLNMENSFSGYKMSDYSCSIDFGFQTGEENKCNPNIVTFGTGYFQVRLRISNIDDISDFKEKSFYVDNLPKTDMSFQKNEIPDPIIEIQSGLDSELSCNKEDCSVNFNGEGSFSGISESGYLCSWNFPGADYSSGITDSCNPGYIHYPPGSYSVTLRISDKHDISNFKEKTIMIRNIFTKTVFLNNTDNITADNVHIGFNSKINVQGAIDGKIRYMESKTLFCHQDECSVNLEGAIDRALRNIRYLWNFGNGTIFEGKNPKSIRYTKGEYVVNMKAIDHYGTESQDYIIIKVLGSEKDEADKKKDIKEEEINIDMDSIFRYIRLSSIMPNPKGNDNLEWIELQNIGQKEMNIRSCKIEAKTLKSSKYYKIKNDLVLNPGSSLKLYKNITKLSLNNTAGTVNLTCGTGLVDTLSWNMRIMDDIVIDRTSSFSGSTDKIKPMLAKTGSLISSDNFKIKIQGKLPKSKKIIGNTLYCETDKICSVDFGINSKKINELSYVWDMGNGQKYLGFAPKPLKYSTGKYEAKLVVLNQFDQVIGTSKMKLVVYKPDLNTKASSKPKVKTKAKPKSDKEIDIKDMKIKKSIQKKHVDYGIYMILTSFIAMILVYLLIRKRIKI